MAYLCSKSPAVMLPMRIAFCHRYKTKSKTSCISVNTFIAYVIICNELLNVENITTFNTAHGYKVNVFTTRSYIIVDMNFRDNQLSRDHQRVHNPQSETHLHSQYPTPSVTYSKHMHTERRREKVASDIHPMIYFQRHNDRSGSGITLKSLVNVSRNLYQVKALSSQSK